MAKDLLKPRCNGTCLLDLRESMATSCTVVIGPNSDTVDFFRLMTIGSFDFDRLFCPAGNCSGSGGLLPNDIDNLSFDGNNWYFRGSVG